ncbi:MAG: hypothetical protein KKA65_05300 [Nanoarchaeota archaeon]|nr:hypothetical protein [Nanoarchaeota archaeon]MBU4242560.1 hypothetical protein [Nanoarchaeota archaeon]MBU4352535.1 hypothetical protein [Nanoarchaeota archaeon]MBU4456888.1 hypothetical protein [Nanoarchaeota archaeon]MCG2719841.1 hypothetical protein [Nanoarchaeota archaeon]
MAESSGLDKIVFIWDYDLTLTEEYQQVPFLADNFKAIKDEYNGKKLISPKTSKPVIIKIEKPSDYFQISDTWAKPHNGVGYVVQLLHDARKGLFKNFTPDGLREAGARVKLSPGMPEFFRKLKKEWKGKCEIEHNIISVGLLPLIEGSPIAKSGEIKGIFATPLFDLNSFLQGKDLSEYNAMSDVVSPFNKTAYTIQIAKGLKENLDKILRHSEYDSNYKKMIVLGDGGSDVSNMAYAKRKGAFCAGVYKHDSTEAYEILMTNLIVKRRIQGVLPRDYRDESTLWTTLNEVISFKLKWDCDFPPEWLDQYYKQKITHPSAEAMVREHLIECSDCGHHLHTSYEYPPKDKEK